MAQPHHDPLSEGNGSPSTPKPQASPDDPKTEESSGFGLVTQEEVAPKNDPIDPTENEDAEADSAEAVVQGTEATVVHAGPSEQRPTFLRRSVASILDDYELALSAGVAGELTRRALKIELCAALEEDYACLYPETAEDDEVPEDMILDDDLILTSMEKRALQ
ncbi:hypothetical protein N7461_008409 [Penicillium sp. DV-2018c]|nr:hypothetical protein N7461_008409 [Penicillium sp. DV-2018c]